MTGGGSAYRAAQQAIEEFEAAALLISAKVHNAQGGAEARTAIMEDKFKSVFATEAQGFELAEESEPVDFLLFGDKAPG